MTFIVVQKNGKGRNVTSILIFDLSVSDIVMRVDIFFKLPQEKKLHEDETL